MITNASLSKQIKTVRRTNRKITPDYGIINCGLVKEKKKWQKDLGDEINLTVLSKMSKIHKTNLE